MLKSLDSKVIFLLLALMSITGLRSPLAHAEERDRMLQQIQLLKLQRQHETLLSQGVANELVTLRTGEYAIQILPKGNSKPNKMASQLLKSKKISLYISQEKIGLSTAAFSIMGNSIFLADSSGLYEELDALLHEVVHGNLKKYIAPGQNDIFHGKISRRIHLQGPGYSDYFRKGMTLEENYTFPFHLRLNEKSAFKKPGKTRDHITTGIEINQLSLEALTDLLQEVRKDSSIVSIGSMDAGMVGGKPGTNVVVAIAHGKNFTFTGFIGSADPRETSLPKLIDGLKNSLQKKIDYYTQAGERWNKVKTSFESKHEDESEHAKEFSRAVRELISGAREQLTPPCIESHLKTSLQ
jgi:hypothetical protein